jgi:penicillin-binding protein 2
MSHQALDRTAKGRSTNPNVWFVGVTPRRNPELVVAVLWQNGQFSYYPARLGAKVVAAYVEKQRRLANNLVPSKQPAPAEVGALWTEPVPPGNGANPEATGVSLLITGRFWRLKHRKSH